MAKIAFLNLRLFPVELKTAIYFAFHYCLLFFVALLDWHPDVK